MFVILELNIKREKPDQNVKVFRLAGQLRTENILKGKIPNKDAPGKRQREREN